MTDVKKPSLVKQLLGAGGGALIAIACYGAYQYASPLLSAYVLPMPWGNTENSIDEMPTLREQQESAKDRMGEAASRARAFVAAAVSSNAAAKSSTLAQASSADSSVVSDAEDSESSASSRSRRSVTDHAGAPLVKKGTTTLPHSGAEASLILVPALLTPVALYRKKIALRLRALIG